MPIKTPIHKEDSNEFLGFVVKGSAGWEAQTIFGYVIERTITQEAAENVLHERGLDYLKGVWQYYDKTERDWFPCVLKDETEHRVTVIRTNSLGFQDSEVFKIVILEDPTENILIKSA